MKYITSIILSLFFIGNTINAQDPTILEEIRIKPLDKQYEFRLALHDMQQISNGEYIMTGHIYAGNSLTTDFAVIKFDADKKILWEYYYKGKAWADIKVLEEPDGYLLYIAPDINNYFAEIKLDKQGKLIWENKGPEISKDNNETYSNTKIILAYGGGTVFSSDLSSTNDLFTRVGDGGKLIWKISKNAHPSINKILELKKGNNAQYVALVNSKNETENAKTLVLTFDDFGKITSELTLPEFIEDGTIIQDSKGNFVIATKVNSIPNDSDIKIIKLTPTGNVIFNDVYGLVLGGNSVSEYDHYYEKINCILETEDNGYILLGEAIHDKTNYTISAYILKIGHDGLFWWDDETKYVERYTSGVSIHAMGNKQYLIGLSSSYSYDNSSAFMILKDNNTIPTNNNTEACPAL